MWNFNLTVFAVFASVLAGTNNAWANLSGLGWRKIAPGPPESVTNVHVVLSDAATNRRNCDVFIDANGQIASAQLVP
jgi:hypothetical protein